MRDKLSPIPEFKLLPSIQGNLPFKLEKLAAQTGYNPAAPHRHNYFELFFFLSGGGLHMIDFKEWDIVPGQIHLLTPGQIHYIRRTPETTGWVFKFTTDFLLAEEEGGAVFNRLPFLRSRQQHPLISAGEQDFQEMLLLIDQIREEIQQRRSGFKDLIHHYLSIVLLKCHRLYDYSETQAESSLTQSFQTLLEKYYLSKKPVSFYCEQLHVSDDKLNQVVKRELGRSPGTLIAERQLLEAKRLLLHTDHSVKEIAYTLHFNDNAYFNRWFRKLAECSPGEFRQRFREKYHSQPE